MYEELVSDLRKGYTDRLKEAADAIEKLIEVIQNRDFLESLIKPRWIPVTERLPEEKYAVLVWVPKYRNHYVCFISDGEWYLYGGHNVIVVGVTHWMPLPEPPEEET